MTGHPGAGASKALPPLLVVLSGPSGAGKDAVLSAMREACPDVFFAVTATTRPQRPGEVDGRDYLFLPEPRFQELLTQGEFMEHAQVYGRSYGVPKGPVRNALTKGQDVVIKVDVQGAATIRRVVPGALLVFLEAPTFDELERRLRSRKTEPEAALRLRLETARLELARRGMFDRVVVNETGALDQAVQRVLAVMDEERRRPGRTRVQV